MARALQNSLALASFKAKRGWETLTLDSIEPKVESELRRKRPRSNGDSSISSGDSDNPNDARNAIFSSSPMTPAIFSDQLVTGSSPILRRTQSFQAGKHNLGYARTSRKHNRSMSNAAASMSARRAWRGDQRQLHSSPLFPRQNSALSRAQIPAISFNSDTSTIPDELPSPTFTNSGDDENELPVHSFQVDSTAPDFPALPRTPPPTRTRGGRLKKANGAAQSEEGADLLLYLATSPSPANPKARTRIAAPATPPQRNPALPSSMMTTPGGTLNFGLGNPQTPSQLFDFTEFVNITPSPAQPFAKSEHLIRTPLAARDARRRLNFDALVPPGASPNLNSTPGSTVNKGLGMKLGELLP
jgi:hypothetical protein